MTSIPEIIDKIKSFSSKKQGKDALSILIIILVAMGSFGLGRYSKSDNENNNISIVGALELKTPENTVKSIQNVSQVSNNINTYEKGNYLASSRGKKYYPVDCPAANNIKVENRIYFVTANEAENKGYTLSTSCN